MKRYGFIIVLFIILVFSLNAQDLNLESADLRLESRADGGFHLFIRKKGNISSVLLTESTRDPTMQADSYAFRAGEWNSVNGNEIRVLNGVPIPAESRVYSLISSTVENHPVLGPSFHIYIPYVLYYGYEEGRHGEVMVADGTYLNIRAFVLPYADYRGPFKDNPFVLEAKQEPPPGPPEGNYLRETLDAFAEIALTGGGEIKFSRDPDDVVNLIKEVLEKETGKSLDIVICFDTTNSMRKYLNPLRQKLIPMLNEILGGFSSFRIGMVLFRDYSDVYLTRLIPFTSDFTRFQRDINAITVGGGGDIPEAVYEALYESITKFSWEAESRMIMLIGDAPPHPVPRGKITNTMVYSASSERDIKVHTMILPQ
ncbi:MAG: VWA domain-containing protein [Treponema sp.]|nr:VWA domain-containing protein [Treponema sp.]